MAKKPDLLTIIIQKGNRRMVAKSPLPGIDRFVFVVNRQFTNAPNTTQISSGAGRSSAAGNNAAINSPYTQQQQSVGAGGKAKNIYGKGRRTRGGNSPFMTRRSGKEVVVVINDQSVKLPKGQQGAAATQVASGGGTYSTGGTNSAIESKGTRQQHAVGGSGTAKNVWLPKGKKPRQPRQHSVRPALKNAARSSRRSKR
ncbi:hypothetical protein EBB07_21350 [Paenibacillaceae bacterium]|nr:hypothetical protein EBB07_21350 [Paenibacillaceae bacterium]